MGYGFLFLIIVAFIHIWNSSYMNHYQDAASVVFFQPYALMWDCIYIVSMCGTKDCIFQMEKTKKNHQGNSLVMKSKLLLSKRVKHRELCHFDIILAEEGG